MYKTMTCMCVSKLERLLGELLRNAGVHMREQLIYP